MDTVQLSCHTHILSTVYVYITQCGGSSVLQFLRVRGWHVERAPLLDLLAPLHTVSDGVTVQHSHIHSDTDRVTVYCSTPVAFSCPPLLNRLPVSPCQPPCGGGTSTLTNRWNTDSRELWDTWEKQIQFEKRTGREICLHYTQRICMLHVSLWILSSDNTGYIPVNLTWNCILFLSLCSPRGGAPEDAGGKGGGCWLVVMGDVVELLAELCQRLPHPSENLLRTGGEECPRRVPWITCGVPRL